MPAAPTSQTRARWFSGHLLQAALWLGASCSALAFGPLSNKPVALPAAAPSAPEVPPQTAITPAVPLRPINTEGDEPVRQAREAFGKKDKARLAALRESVLATRHTLAPWVDYWELNLRLSEARSEEVDAFLARWPGSYVEDRLRNDWLLELGHRRDWATFQKELPRYRMNDDREVACYAQLANMQSNRPSASQREAAQAAWTVQRDADEGCQLLAQSMYNAKLLPEAAVWRKLEQATEYARLRLAKQTAALLGDATARAVAEALDQPARYLSRKAAGQRPAESPRLVALALARLAATDAAGAGTAAQQMDERWSKLLSPEQRGWVWANIARQSAQNLQDSSLEWVRRAWSFHAPRQTPEWSDETLGWLARAALRLGQGQERWNLTLRALDAMSATERQESAWQYWRARALQALAPAGSSGDGQRAEAKQILSTLASPLHFYGQLAAEDLGAPAALPSRATPPSTEEQSSARQHPGLHRALHMIATGLRPEGVREWNFYLLNMSERELLAAAQLACEREVWDRCINTSERTRTEIDMEQRYPMPLRNEVVARTREIGLDTAYVYGLIRQESRFVTDARSHVGASGLMQVMPATAKWTAKKIGMTDFRPEMISERETNLKIGTAYLKLVLDDQDGAQALAAAAYNAGPGRPRRWRNGPVLEPAIWAENVPFAETRDYVKKVTANATLYASLMTGKPASLKARLGASVGPRDASAPPSTSPQDLP